VSDHSEGRPSNEDVTEALASQNKRSPMPNHHRMEPVDDLDSLSQSFHSFTEDNAELGDVS
jgi:hypothetical protein